MTGRILMLLSHLWAADCDRLTHPFGPVRDEARRALEGVWPLSAPALAAAQEVPGPAAFAARRLYYDRWVRTFGRPPTGP